LEFAVFFYQKTTQSCHAELVSASKKTVYLHFKSYKMRKTYLFCLLFISLCSSAQIINIPDANLKAKLLAANPSNTLASIETPTYDSNSKYCTVTSYNSIDTNNDGEIQISEAILIKYLNISSAYDITLNPEGISAFTNLEALGCVGNNLTTLNLTQNTNLKFLNCSGNDLTNIDLSQNTLLTSLLCNDNQLTNLSLTQNTLLRDLKCFQNQISSLNLSQNTLLNSLDCPSNNLTNLDLSQNINLEYLNLAGNNFQNLNVTQNINLLNLNIIGNQLSNIDTNQNTLLAVLYCAENQLTSLNLTQNILLNELKCYNNPLSNLNVSQNNLLTVLLCDNNQLTNLDLTQNSLLTDLSCSQNQLTSLNLLQNTLLEGLNCDNNQLQSLNLTQNYLLSTLECNNNQLVYLYLKNGISEYTTFNNNPNLIYICVDENQINNIQNRITQYGYTNCHTNTYCSFYPGGELFMIQGQQKFDNEEDGCDSSDNPLQNILFSISDGTTTNLISSDNNGNFFIPVQQGEYTITAFMEESNFFTISPNDSVINFPSQSSPFVQNFCFSLDGIHSDVEVSIIPIEEAIPGFDAYYKIIYKNKGNQVENGVINFQFDDAILDVISSNPSFTTQTTNNLSFNYSNLNPYETREINIVLNVNSPTDTPAVISGDILNYTVTNTITNTDEMLSDNTFVLNQTVVNSYDPNDKTCLQGNYVSPDKIGEFVHYMIRFENTGTFPAENIVVKDMIDTAKFDISSLIPLHASHNYITRITDNKVEFIFENINLPFDDATNDGYIAFKIRTLPTLVLGDTFSNSANIYFDYNFPIITNTATTTIAALSNPSFEFANYFSLYPNPTTNELNINLKSAIEINSIQIYNTIGQLVTVQTGNALKVDVTHLKTGNYFIKINTNEGYSTSQFIKE
jgi:hypothetical protein